MKISDKLKKVIFKKLYEDLSNVEIIPYKNSIWFIDRENKYWYFEYQKNGTLWWRYNFFINFFEFFSTGVVDFKPLLCEWVEEVLNCKVVTTSRANQSIVRLVEEVLNCKVVTTHHLIGRRITGVEEVLNCKVVTTYPNNYNHFVKVEEVLNCKVVTTRGDYDSRASWVEEVLNCKVVTTYGDSKQVFDVVEEVLNDNG